jgi:hypothetical protein
VEVIHVSKTLIIFYSKTGHVKLLAQKAAELLDADMEELIDHSRWTGIDGFFRRARRAIKRGTTELDATRYDPKNYNKIVVLSPIWASTITPAVRTYLKDHNTSIRELSLIVMGGFTDDPSISKEEVDSMGFKLNGILGLLEKNKSDNLIKLKEFIEKI